ncbi:MAG TPA: hypothetical protein VGQ59_19430 [Cyclobacteriaceae bacterium]|jgi:hypothetical protein|nr:hypothetical protein [Cyclobacteriaceae bacterium]
METQLIRTSILTLLVMAALNGYAQKYKPVGVGIIDSVLKYRKSGRKITAESFNGIAYKNESISGVKFLSDKSVLIKKFGKGEPFKKKFIDNTVDIDNPTIYYRNYIKYGNSLFEIDDSNKFCGFIVRDSIFPLEQYNIRVGDKLGNLAIKLPTSFKEIGISEDNFHLMIRLLDFDCGTCSANIVLYIDRKSKKLVSIEQRISH